jgi:uncharacterized protein (DUF2336 family)
VTQDIETSIDGDQDMTVRTMRTSLSADDVQRLVRSPDAEERASSARRICRRIAVGGLSEADQAAALYVLEFIMADAAETVRRALAITLKNSPHLPRELALRLIEEADAIAEPVLEWSPVLTEDDLIRVVETGVPSRQISVAKRQTLGARLVRALTQHGCEAAVATVASNNGANFDHISYGTVLRRFGHSKAVTDGLIARRHIPMDIAEKLVSLVSDEALKRLAQRHELPPQLAVELAEGARERATIDLIDQARCSTDLQRFVQQLNLNGRLTPSLVLRGLCAGAMGFFEHCMAELAGVPHQKAWVLVHDTGPLGLRALFDRAGLPERAYAVIRTAVDVYHVTDMSEGAESRRRFSQRITQRILTQRQNFAADDLNYLLDRLDARGDVAPEREVKAA